MLGIHRSGTSALMKTVSFVGVSLGKDLAAPRPDNPTGFWEHRGIVAQHDALLSRLGSYWDDPFPLPEGWAADPAVARPLRRSPSSCGRFRVDLISRRP